MGAPLPADDRFAMSEIPYAGWARAARLSNGIVELVATLEVGPRLLRFAFIGGENAFYENPGECGLTGGDQWRAYGGHRLWHAPEAWPRTYAPDNDPVLYSWDGEWLTLEPPLDTTCGLAKMTSVRLEEGRPAATVRHRLTNAGLWPIELGAWALTVLPPGGRAIFPREPFRPHTLDTLLPSSAIALWPYTLLGDPRWTWGNRYVQLRQDPTETEPTKFGYANRSGWAAYVRGNLVFVHRFMFDDRARYPDRGSNCESFTNGTMLELESLGPLTVLEPGASTEHGEEWLIDRLDVGPSEEDIDASLGPLVREA